MIPGELATLHLMGRNITKSLLANYKDPRDIGTILSIAMSTFLINTPDQDTFNDYKKAFVECLYQLTWKEVVQ